MGEFSNAVKPENVNQEVPDPGAIAVNDSKSEEMESRYLK